MVGLLRRVDNLNSLTKLKSLDFSNNRLTDTQGLDHITSLESLKLDHNPISRLSASFVSNIYLFLSLFMFLHLQHFYLFIVCFDIMYLSSLPSLRKLSMCGTSISALLPTIEALKAYVFKIVLFIFLL